MNTIEGNKLIAEFMGAKYDGRKYMIFPDGRHIVHGDEYDSDLKYHSSWDWLMPVWVKFRKDVWKNLGGYPNQFEEFKERFLRDVFNGEISFAHKTIMEAIEWYNKEQSVKESDTSKAK